MMGTRGTLFRLAVMVQSIPKEVLVVEDEALIRIAAADALAESGIMAWEAGDAEEALEKLASHPLIGLMFTDVNMPGNMNGIDLADHVSKLRPDVGLIVTSGAANIPDKNLPDHGIFLSKPYSTQRLVKIVSDKLDNPEE